LIILHGPYGEDGTIQGLLELLHIPYQGSGVLGSSVAMNKLATKQMYELAGLPTPPYMVLKQGDRVDAADCEERFGLPLVVKPLEAGSSVGMTIVKSASEIETAAEKAFRYGDAILLENFVDGTEITVGVIGNQTLGALPIIEIVPGDGYEFFDYEAKYTPGATREICPARISDAMTEKAQAYAKMAHEALFCEGYSRTDMIMQSDEIYILETNTIPGMTATSLLPQAAVAAGISFSELLDRLIELGMERHRLKRKT
jgi:D-alanine-D-alanine ligase